MAVKKEYIDAYLAAGGQFDPDKMTKEQLTAATRELNALAQLEGEEAKKEALRAYETKEAKVVEVVASYSQTIQPEQFKPQNYFCSMKAEVAGGNVSAIAKDLAWRCKNEVTYRIKKDSPNKQPF